jgi:hypothetical protein
VAEVQRLLALYRKRYQGSTSAGRDDGATRRPTALWSTDGAVTGPTWAVRTPVPGVGPRPHTSDASRPRLGASRDRAYRRLFAPDPGSQRPGQSDLGSPSTTHLTRSSRGRATPRSSRDVNHRGRRNAWRRVRADDNPGLLPDQRIDEIRPDERGPTRDQDLPITLAHLSSSALA